VHIERTIWGIKIEIHQKDLEPLNGLSGMVEEEIRQFLARLGRKLRDRFGPRIHIHVEGPYRHG